MCSRWRMVVLCTWRTEGPNTAISTSLRLSCKINQIISNMEIHCTCTAYVATPWENPLQAYILNYHPVWKHTVGLHPKLRPLKIFTWSSTSRMCSSTEWTMQTPNTIFLTVKSENVIGVRQSAVCSGRLSLKPSSSSLKQMAMIEIYKYMEA